jgi:hypothetical protein
MSEHQITVALDWLYEDGMLAILRAMVKELGNQQAVATVLGVSPQYISDVLHKRRQIGTGLARALGYEAIRVYVEKRKQGKTL